MVLKDKRHGARVERVKIRDMKVRWWFFLYAGNGAVAKVTVVCGGYCGDAGVGVDIVMVMVVLLWCCR